jgi:predicted RNase H-like HicB family nuclease
MTYPLKLEYTVQIWEEDGQFIAHAMPLDVMSSGPTVEAARGALDEAVSLFLDTAADAGTLAEVLEECGFDLQQGRWISPVWVSLERHSAVVRG